MSMLTKEYAIRIFVLSRLWINFSFFFSLKIKVIKVLHKGTFLLFLRFFLLDNLFGFINLLNLQLIDESPLFKNINRSIGEEIE